MWDNAHAHLLSMSKIVGTVVAKHGIIRREPVHDPFTQLVRAIVGQQLSVKAASSISQRLTIALGGAVSAGSILQTSHQVLRDAGLSEAKVRSVMDLASRTEDGRIDVCTLKDLEDAEAVRLLTDVRGIGPWTAQMFLIFTLARPDVLPVGDLGIQSAVHRLFALPARPLPAEISAIAHEDNWHPYATVASLHLWQSLE